MVVGNFNLLTEWRVIMKNIDQKPNKKHLSFLAACLCTTIFFNDSPSWGMEPIEEDQRGMKRAATAELIGEVERPAKKQRMETRGKIDAWLTENFEKNPDSFLSKDGLPQLVSFCMEKNLSIKNLRMGLKNFVQKQKTYLSSAHKDLEFYNPCIDDTLDANPIVVLPTIGASFRGSTSYQIPEQTKTLVKNNIKDHLHRKIKGIQTIENIIRDIEPICIFTEGVLSVKGTLIGTSDIEHYCLKMPQTQYDELNEIRVSSPILLIDKSMECQGAFFTFDVLHFLVMGKRNINLSGINGTIGLPGTNGGNFIGKANEFEHLNNLTIITNGGNGGDGIPGANGMDADLSDLGEPKKPEPYSCTHEPGAENPSNPWFQFFPKKINWTIKGTRNFYEKLGEPGKPGTKGGAGGAGGLIHLIKTPHNEIFVDTRGPDGIPGKDGPHGKHGKTAKAIKLANSEISYQTLVQQAIGNFEGWNILGVGSKGHEQLPDMWEVAPHHVLDRDQGELSAKVKNTSQSSAINIDDADKITSYQKKKAEHDQRRIKRHIELVESETGQGNDDLALHHQMEIVKITDEQEDRLLAQSKNNDPQQ